MLVVNQDRLLMVLEGFNAIWYCDAFSLLGLVASCTTLKRKSIEIAKDRFNELAKASLWSDAASPNLAPVVRLALAWTLQCLEKILPRRTNKSSLATVRCGHVDIVIPEMALFTGGSRSVCFEALRSKRLYGLGRLFLRGHSVLATSATDLGSVVAHSDTLAIIIDNAELGDTAAELIVASLADRTSTRRLRVLALQNCGIGPLGFNAIASALSNSHTSIVAIDLASNHFGYSDDCGKTFFQAISAAPTLTGLELSGNSIDDNTARSAAEFLLRKSKTMQWLGLASNFITDAGATALAEAISISASLCFLALKRNRRIKPPTLSRLSKAQRLCPEREKKYLFSLFLPVIDILPMYQATARKVKTDEYKQGEALPSFDLCWRLWWTRCALGLECPTLDPLLT